MPIARFTAVYSGVIGKAMVMLGTEEHYLNLSLGYFRNFAETFRDPYRWYTSYWDEMYTPLMLTNISTYQQISPKLGIQAELLACTNKDVCLG